MSSQILLQRGPHHRGQALAELFGGAFQVVLEAAGQLQVEPGEFRFRQHDDVIIPCQTDIAKGMPGQAAGVRASVGRTYDSGGRSLGVHVRYEPMDSTQAPNEVISPSELACPHGRRIAIESRDP